MEPPETPINNAGVTCPRKGRLFGLVVADDCHRSQVTNNHWLIDRSILPCSTYRDYKRNTDPNESVQYSIWEELW